MQIIGGIAGGIKLSVPKGNNVRPTSVRARKALFDSISDFKDKVIYDIFAGSGALGLEAASRGASKVVLVEQSALHCRLIKENIAKITKAGVDCEFKIYQQNALKFIPSPPMPDLVFFDPPYKDSLSYFEKFCQEDHWLNNCSSDLIIWEIPHNTPSGAFSTTNWTSNKIRNFGGTNFLFLNS
jgi:16S rRNA (guanine966-N2)-methyltransferase